MVHHDRNRPEINPYRLEIEVARIFTGSNESQRVPTTLSPCKRRNRIADFHQQSTNLTFHPPANKSFSQLAVIVSILHPIRLDFV